MSSVHVDVFPHFRVAQANYWHWENHICSPLLSKVWERKVPSLMRPWTNKIIYCEMLLRKTTNYMNFSLPILSLSLRHAKIHLLIACKEYIFWVLLQCHLGAMPFLFMLNDKLSNLWHRFVALLSSFPVKMECFFYAEKILEFLNYQ